MGLLAMRKAGWGHGRTDRFLEDTIEHVPHIKQSILEMADRAHFLDADLKQLYKYNND